MLPVATEASSVHFSGSQCTMRASFQHSEHACMFRADLHQIFVANGPKTCKTMLHVSASNMLFSYTDNGMMTKGHQVWCGHWIG